MDLKKIVRPCIYSLEPYSCARNEFKGDASVFLDANENPMNYPYNRYPDPLQIEVKKKISAIKGPDVSQIMLGNGSDEVIDLVYRIFCEPGKDNVIAIEPTYGMYKVCADINNVKYIPILLNDDFSLDSSRILDAVNGYTKVIWLCSPNNPSGNDLEKKEVENILDNFEGIVVIDEAYIDFALRDSWISALKKYDNLIVLQTFSKAWAMASIRCGMAFSSLEIIEFFNKVKYPYNVNFLTQKFVSKSLDDSNKKEEWVRMLIEQRSFMIEELKKIPLVNKIYPTAANFFLVDVGNATDVYNYLCENKIIVRNRNKVTKCYGCLRITVGTREENITLLDALKKLK